MINKMSHCIVVFTDLDGTFLDHNDYSFAAAESCLDFIKKQNIPLIFTSSKTAVEIHNLCTETDSYHPYISENGGLLSIPKNYFSSSNSPTTEYEHVLIGTSRNDINTILETLHKSYEFTSFREMTIDEIMACTGLSKDLAIMANQRECTEPVLWQDSEEHLKQFSKAIQESNLHLVSGGRFHHVMGKHDKATTMLILLEYFEKNINGKVTSIALGDSPNDYKMLQTADYGILIPNPAAPKQCLDKHENLIYANHVGPHGWNDSLLNLLEELLA